MGLGNLSDSLAIGRFNLGAHAGLVRAWTDRVLGTCAPYATKYPDTKKLGPSKDARKKASINRETSAPSDPIALLSVKYPFTNGLLGTNKIVVQQMSSI